MSRYTAQIDVAASAERAFGVLIDAARFSQWQTLALRAFDQTGPLSRPGSSVRIDHGPGMKRTLTVLEAERPRFIRYRQSGMGAEDVTEVRFDPIAHGTQVTMSAELRVAGGPIGAFLERLSRGRSRRELQVELARFGMVVDRPATPASPSGTIVTADSGAGYRVMKVLAADDAVVHVALLPGTARERPTDATAFLDAETSLADPLALKPLEVSLRGMTRRIVPGQPVLRLDGGVGVPHLALSLDAYNDGQPRALGEPLEVWDDELAEVASWRVAGGPVLGRDVDAGITTLSTVREEGGYGAVKLLHADRNGVHIRTYADRWDMPPDVIDPWALRLGTIHEPIQGIGHLPLSRGAFVSMDPSFSRLAMIGPAELEGYRMWRESGGGFFA